jgi:hypothetical protein
VPSVVEVRESAGRKKVDALFDHCMAFYTVVFGAPVPWADGIFMAEVSQIVFALLW